jgi:hypothetical protein
LTFAFHQYSVNQVLTLLTKADVIYKQDLDANFSQITGSLADKIQIIMRFNGLTQFFRVYRRGALKCVYDY